MTSPFVGCTQVPDFESLSCLLSHPLISSTSFKAGSTCVFITKPSEASSLEVARLLTPTVPMIYTFHKQRRARSITQTAFQDAVCQPGPQRFSLSRSEPSGSAVELCGSAWGHAWVRASSDPYRWVSSPLSSWVLYWDSPLQLTG